MKVKIIGAGSIGNHFAHAARGLNWEVLLTDEKSEALNRAVEQIYPSRYGRWDPEIETAVTSSAPLGGFDLIIVGTPPDSHLEVASQACSELPGAILVEKPICKPYDSNLAKFLEVLSKSRVLAFAGYNHVLSPGVTEMVKWVEDSEIGEIKLIESRFREHWSGIFAAHPWLSGPADSYLGFWRRGGGALGEHSHALNLWDYFVDQLLPDTEFSMTSADLIFRHEEPAVYDASAELSFRSSNGVQGRVVQDVLTDPAEKSVVVVGSQGKIELSFGKPDGFDSLVAEVGEERNEVHFPKTRAAEFERELIHIETFMLRGEGESPISFHRGVRTLRRIEGAFDLFERETSNP